MATGASTADLAIILIDARHGVLTQTRRHAFIASLLGIPHVVVAINKMDLVDYSEEVFDAIRQEYGVSRPAWTSPTCTFIPISALHGDNVVDRSPRMPWYTRESTLLHHLETVYIGERPEPRGLPLAGPVRRCARTCTSAASAGRSPRAS